MPSILHYLPPTAASQLRSTARYALFSTPYCLTAYCLRPNGDLSFPLTAE